MVVQEGESLNTLFQTLADWEHQLKSLEEDAHRQWDEPSP